MELYFHAPIRFDGMVVNLIFISCSLEPSEFVRRILNKNVPERLSQIGRPCLLQVDYLVNQKKCRDPFPFSPLTLGVQIIIENSESLVQINFPENP